MKNSNKGFTLIEVLVAMGIVVLIAMAFFSINNMSIKVNDKNEKNIQSMNIAQSVMEDVRGYIKEGTAVSYLTGSINDNNWTENSRVIKNVSQTIGSSAYTADIKIERQTVGSRYLYTVTVNVSAPNNNKKTNLITQIFEM
jgi:prepilin-type N-terminal cleavage/methylation domain-containing protein